MDGHRYEAVSDEALQREIEAALGVDPCPEFLPRVRARIAEARVHEAWLASAWWRWAGAALAAVIVVGVWALRNPAPAGNEVHMTPTIGIATPPIESSSEALAPGGSTAESSASARVDPVTARTPGRIERPAEVLVSPDDAAALRHLVMAVAARQVKAVDIPELGVESAPLPPIEEIVLEPIKVRPLGGIESE